jgi:hypothetical protein
MPRFLRRPAEPDYGGQVRGRSVGTVRPLVGLASRSQNPGATRSESGAGQALDLLAPGFWLLTPILSEAALQVARS